MGIAIYTYTSQTQTPETYVNNMYIIDRITKILA